MKIMFACGGTAGHIYPAIAMAEIIKHKHPDTKIVFAGRKSGMEKSIIEESGYDFLSLDIRSISKKITAENIKAVFKLLLSFDKAKKIIEDENPDAIIGTGGYVCYPMIKEAIKLGIPTAVHESNALPGKAVKMLMKKTDAVWIGTRASEQYIKKAKKVIYTGTPLRRGFSDISLEQAKRKLGFAQNDTVVLSFGGSLGSEILNSEMLKCMHELKNEKIKFIHICGKQYPEFKDSVVSPGNIILTYTSDMPLYMRAADLIICRSGALTLTEISCCGTPSILIPSPNVADDHQYYNAKDVVSRGAALMIEEKELKNGILKSTVSGLLGNKKKYRLMKEKANYYNQKSVNANIENAIMALIKK